MGITLLQNSRKNYITRKVQDQIYLIVFLIRKLFILSICIFLREDSEGYTDVPEEENSTATGNKCRKYRIIRVRRRTNVAFDWKDEKESNTNGSPAKKISS